MATLLTPRWFEINPKAINHPEQIRLLNTLKNKSVQNIVVAAGRRSFKTERFAKRYLIGECVNPVNKNMFYYAGAPTLSQAREIFWNDLKQLTPKWCVKKISEVSMRIEFKGGNTLRVVGLKEFKRIQGQLMHGIVITEYQECEEGVYSESIEPMINDTNGWCIKEGRPRGKNHFHDDYLKGLNGEENWASFHWTAEDILTQIQINRAKSNLGEQDYNREYLASFETGSSDPYYSYSELNHKVLEIDYKRSVNLTCDFNATEAPMSWVLGQKFNNNGIDNSYWHKCFSYQFTNTLKMCEVLDRYFTEHLGDNYFITINLYGDYRSGKAEQSNSSYTDWEIIHKYFANKVKFNNCYKSCTSIRNSIGATNAQLCNTLKERKQFVNPIECKALISDWQKCEWAENEMELKEEKNTEGVKRGHLCRAVDYYNDYEYPIKGLPTSEWGSL